MIKSLENIAKDLNLSFFFGYPETLNQIVEASNMPAVLVVFPTSISDFGNSRFANWQTVIYFADKVDPEYSDMQKFKIIEECRNNAVKFLKKINESGTLYYKNAQQQTFDFELNCRVCGVSVTLLLKELRTTCNDLT